MSKKDTPFSSEAYNAALCKLQQAELDYECSLADYRNCRNASSNWTKIKDPHEYQALAYGLELLKRFVSECLQSLTQARSAFNALKTT